MGEPKEKEVTGKSSSARQELLDRKNSLERQLRDQLKDLSRRLDEALKDAARSKRMMWEALLERDRLLSEPKPAADAPAPTSEASEGALDGAPASSDEIDHYEDLLEGTGREATFLGRFWWWLLWRRWRRRLENPLVKAACIFLLAVISGAVVLLIWPH